jgi:hypothetical protein
VNMVANKVTFHNFALFLKRKHSENIAKIFPQISI